MYKDYNQKDNRRKDAIYNPIEGKWEKRHNPLGDDDMASKIQDVSSKIRDVFSKIQNPYKIIDPENGTSSSLNTLKQITYKQVKKLKDIKIQQDIHDQKYSQVSEEEYIKGKKEENLLIIKIAIAIILLLIVGISRF